MALGYPVRLSDVNRPLRPSSPGNTRIRLPGRRIPRWSGRHAMPYKEPTGGPRAMSFHSIYRHGFARVAACVTASSVANPTANAAAILAAARSCHDQGAAVAVFPELCLSGYAIEDLVKQDALLDAVQRGLLTLVEASHDLVPVLIVGAPLRFAHRIYNCAVVIHRGEVLGVVPKSYLPTYREFYEGR